MKIERDPSWLEKPASELSFVVFDTETTGRYPLESEICEVAAVKWHQGRIVDEFQAFIKPRRPMGADVIQIHRITNDMVADAPFAREVLTRFLDFISDSIVVAHHAPFDLGFISSVLDELNIPIPEGYAICTSLFARRVISDSPNHKLQTLIKHLSLEQGQAHRALDDSIACLGVFKGCMQRLGGDPTLAKMIQGQGVDLTWERFSLKRYHEIPGWTDLIRAMRSGPTPAKMVYASGSRPGLEREILAIGLVRSLDGDFLIARDIDGDRPKRFFAESILKMQKISEF
jgi:DNA polymerase III subunit epsilon